MRFEHTKSENLVCLYSILLSDSDIFGFSQALFTSDMIFLLKNLHALMKNGTIFNHCNSTKNLNNLLK